LLGAFFGSRANAGPRTELRCGGKGCSVGANFGHNLLRRIYQESRHLCHSFYGIFVLLQTLGQVPIQRLDLFVQQLQAG
jgi:hypothetical protein